MYWQPIRREPVRAVPLVQMCRSLPSDTHARTTARVEPDSSPPTRTRPGSRATPCPTRARPPHRLPKRGSISQIVRDSPPTWRPAEHPTYHARESTRARGRATDGTPACRAGGARHSSSPCRTWLGAQRCACRRRAIARRDCACQHIPTSTTVLYLALTAPTRPRSASAAAHTAPFRHAARLAACGRSHTAQ